MAGPRCDFQMLGQQTGSKIGSPSCCNQVRRRWNHLLPDSCPWCFGVMVLEDGGGLGLVISASSIGHSAVKGQHGIDVIQIQIVTDGMRLNKCWWRWRSKRGLLFWPCCHSFHHLSWTMQTSRRDAFDIYLRAPLLLHDPARSRRPWWEPTSSGVLGAFARRLEGGDGAWVSSDSGGVLPVLWEEHRTC